MDYFLQQVTDMNEAEQVLFVSGIAENLTVGKIYVVQIDDDGSFCVEGERFVFDDLHKPNNEFFVNPLLEVKYYAVKKS